VNDLLDMKSVIMQSLDLNVSIINDTGTTVKLFDLDFEHIDLLIKLDTQTLKNLVNIISEKRY